MPPVRELVVSPPPPLAEYSAQMLKQRLERMLTHCVGVRQGITNEPVHQMRVWSRRTRAALEVFLTCFHGKEFDVIQREVKRVADALGEARDLDVMIENMIKKSANLPENQRPGVEAFIEALTIDRTACQISVDRAVERLQKHDLGTMVERLVPTPTAEAAEPAALVGQVS